MAVEKRPGKKAEEKKCPIIFSTARHNPITYNNMKSNYSPTSNLFVKFFNAYWVIIGFNHWTNFLVIIWLDSPCRKIWSGRWSAQARNVGSQCWLSILDRWLIEAWMVIADLYWLVILAPKSLPIISRKSLPELNRWSLKFIMILIMAIKFKT